MLLDYPLWVGPEWGAPTRIGCVVIRRLRLAWLEKQVGIFMGTKTPFLQYTIVCLYGSLARARVYIFRPCWTIYNHVPKISFDTCVFIEVFHFTIELSISCNMGDF